LSTLRHRLEDLARLQDRAARSRLITELVAEYSRTATAAPTPLERDLFSSIVLLVFDDLDRHARFELVVRLAKTDRISPDLADRLAREEFELSEPVLLHSPVLSETTLLRTIRTGGDAHRLAIASRPLLSEKVCDALIANGSDEVVLALLSNGSSALSVKAALALLIRADTSESILSAMAWRAQSDTGFYDMLQIALETGCPLIPERLSAALKADTLDTLTSSAGRHHSAAAINRNKARYSDHEAIIEVASGEISVDTLLFTLVKQDRLEAASWLLAHQLKLHRSTVEKMLTSNADGTIMKLMLESDVSPRTYRAFLDAKWAETPRSPRAIASLMLQFRAERRKPQIVYL